MLKDKGSRVCIGCTNRVTLLCGLLESKCSLEDIGMFKLRPCCKDSELGIEGRISGENDRSADRTGSQ